MADTVELTLGEERSTHLPPLSGGDWTYEIDGMESAVDVRKLWAADPYPEDDEDEDKAREVPDVVFMIRGVAPGSATIRFTPSGSGGPEPHEVRVAVRGEAS